MRGRSFLDSNHIVGPAPLLASTDCGMLNIMRPGLNGWHAGEKALQRKLDYSDEVNEAFVVVASDLSAQHRLFHSSNLSFLPIATSSPTDGSVWCSILFPSPSNPPNTPGSFIFSPSPTSLFVLAEVWDGDPIQRTLEEGGLVAAVGVELSTRRRNKFAGSVGQLGWSPDKKKLGFEVRISEALGNCPKYITTRELAPHPSHPAITHSHPTLSPKSSGLPPSLIAFIHSSSSLYLATSSGPSTPSFPSHLGCNHRGGPPGFVRVLPSSNGRTLVIPDYSGNRFMSSLGNIELDPHVGLAFPDFGLGGILYITGTAKNVVGPDATKIMERCKVVTVVEITGFVFVEDALGVRAVVGGREEPSPYTPGVRYLVEEREASGFVVAGAGGQVEVKLVGMERLGPDVATFAFEAEGMGEWTAGQFVVLDCLDLLGGEIGYQHMSFGNERSVNEDGVRTWTISSPPTPSSPTRFAITLRHIPKGAITSRLFSLLSSYNPLSSLTLRLLGTGGTFILPTSPQPLLLIAGGIGITPFLAFLGEISSRRIEKGEAWEVSLLVATREPEVTLDLVRRALAPATGSGTLRLDLHLFTSSAGSAPSTGFAEVPRTTITLHPFRLGPAFFATPDGRRALDGKAYLCGPGEFEKGVVETLEEVGFKGGVEREKFNY